MKYFETPPLRIPVIILMFKINNSCDFLTDKLRTANSIIIVFFRTYMIYDDEIHSKYIV